MTPEPAGNGDGEVMSPAAIAAAERDWPRAWIPAFLRAYALTGIITRACEAAGISKQTYYVALRGEKTRPDGTATPLVDGFAEAMKEAREEAVDVVEEVAHRVATFGMPYEIVTVKRRVMPDGTVETTEQKITGTHRSNQVLLRWLEAMRPERWARRADLRIGGADGGAIQHEVVSHTPRTPARVLELAQMVQELGIGRQADDSIEAEAVEVDGDEGEP